MKECYALIYQRFNSNEGITIDNLRLPPDKIVLEIQRRVCFFYLLDYFLFKRQFLKNVYRSYFYQAKNIIINS